jgi:hypothetical protein
MKKFLREHWFLLVLTIATLATVILFTGAWPYKKLLSGIISAPMLGGILHTLLGRMIPKKKKESYDYNEFNRRPLFGKKRK